MSQEHQPVRLQDELRLTTEHVTEVLESLARGVGSLEAEFVAKEENDFHDYPAMLSFLIAGAAAMTVLRLLVDGFSADKVVETTLSSG